MVELTAFHSIPPVEAASTASMLPAHQPCRAQLVLVDLENLPAASLRGLDKDAEVIVFVGSRQQSVPLELALLAQRLGSTQFRFQRIPGSGPNALDFFIACELGRRLERNPDTICTVLSNDKGFDPLLKYLNIKGLECQRKGSLIEPMSPSVAVSAATIPTTASASDNIPVYFNKVLDTLKKSAARARPSKRAALKNHISAMCQKNISDTQINAVIQHLVSKKLIALNGEQITYKF